MRKWQTIDRFLGAVARPEGNLLSKIAVVQWCETVLLTTETKATMSTSEIAEFKAEVIEPTVTRLFQQVYYFSPRLSFFVQGAHPKTKFTNVNLPTQRTRDLDVQVINVRSLHAATTALGTTTANLPMTSIATSYYQFFERPVAVGCINHNMPTIVLQQENQHLTNKLWNLSLFRDDPADPRAGRLLRALLDTFMPGSFWTFLYTVLQSLFQYFDDNYRHPPTQAHMPPDMMRDREETDDMRWTRLVTAYDPSAAVVTPPCSMCPRCYYQLHTEFTLPTHEDCKHHLLAAFQPNILLGCSHAAQRHQYSTTINRHVLDRRVRPRRRRDHI